MHKLGFFPYNSWIPSSSHWHQGSSESRTAWARLVSIKEKHFLEKLTSSDDFAAASSQLYSLWTKTTLLGEGGWHSQLSPREIMPALHYHKLGSFSFNLNFILISVSGSNTQKLEVPDRLYWEHLWCVSSSCCGLDYFPGTRIFTQKSWYFHCIAQEWTLC